jgi:hypothetical protein
MTPTRSLLCGCCARALAPVALAARRGHGPSATPLARGRHGAAAARQARQNQGVQGYSPMFVAALAAAGVGRGQIQSMGREIPAALLMG